jgi:cephalosporin-C deacetylase-like acetyl esterase
MEGAHDLVERKIAESMRKRAGYWQYDFSSTAAYEQSIAPNRERFKKIIGVVDQERTAHITMELFGDDQNPALVADTEDFQIHQVRWPVLDGVFSEGLLVTPKPESAGYTVFVPDADQTPEQLIGLAEGDTRIRSRLRQAVADGQTLIIPTLINRQIYLGPAGDDTRLGRTDQTHREWIYRQAFHMGRHIIGYEVQKVLVAVDWTKRHAPDTPVRVAGVGEGALVAFYAGACDPRIDAVVLHGYFGSRERIWAEPIYRNLHGLLREFGDAEIASLIHPRPLLITPASSPAVENQKGSIPPFDLQQARKEIDRVPQAASGSVQVVVEKMDADPALASLIPDRRQSFDPVARHARLFRQLETHVQLLVRQSGTLREEFFLYAAEPRLRPGKWSTNKQHPTLDPDRFVDAGKKFRHRFHEEAIGKFDEPLLPPNARSRKILETPAWTAYDVVLDVYPELFAWGVLVLPNDIQPGERRPVVVCQHGRGGLPRDTVDGHTTAYNDFAARLAKRGFITFAPHNLYRGEDRYRWLDRKANSIGCTLFSFITVSHRQILNWLKAQPFVDPNRIAFYGLSYGGETAVRVPAILEDYCLSICSGDFNQWTRKVAATDFPGGFMNTIEWEMPYWNLGHTFDYAEMAYLIFPRPFMVERGHHDRVSVDHWVAHEYAKVRWLYAQFGMADRTEIEFFQGGHAINGQATFAFLHKHLDWPGPD